MTAGKLSPTAGGGDPHTGGLAATTSFGKIPAFAIRIGVC